MRRAMSRVVTFLTLAAVCVFAAALRAADRPPLIDAAKNVDKAAVRALLEKGADVNAVEPDGATALHWASYRDDVESAELLIRAGARVNANGSVELTS